MRFAHLQMGGDGLRPGVQALLVSVFRSRTISSSTSRSTARGLECGHDLARTLARVSGLPNEKVRGLSRS